MTRCPQCQVPVPDSSILHRDFLCCGGRRPDTSRR